MARGTSRPRSRRKTGQEFRRRPHPDGPILLVGRSDEQKLPCRAGSDAKSSSTAIPAATPDFMSRSPRPGRKSPLLKSASARGSSPEISSVSTRSGSSLFGRTGEVLQRAVIVDRHRLEMAAQQDRPRAGPADERKDVRASERIVGDRRNDEVVRMGGEIGDLLQEMTPAWTRTPPPGGAGDTRPSGEAQRDGAGPRGERRGRIGGDLVFHGSGSGARGGVANRLRPRRPRRQACRAQRRGPGPSMRAGRVLAEILSDRDRVIAPGTEWGWPGGEDLRENASPGPRREEGDMAAIEVHGYAIVSRRRSYRRRERGDARGAEERGGLGLFQAELDRAALTVLGRLGHEANPNPKNRLRMVLSSSVRGLERRAEGWWWNPAGTTWPEAVAQGVAGRGARGRARAGGGCSICSSPSATTSSI